MDVTIEKKLQDLWKVQQIDSRIDAIRAVMGELPMEVADLEDEIAGLETRVEHIQGEMSELKSEISNKKNAIKDFQALIEKYDDQLNNIKNSREYDAISKEKEIAGLEILSAEKKIKDLTAQIEAKSEVLTATEESLDSKRKDIEFKKSELGEIEKENEEELEKLGKERDAAAKKLDDRYHRAYHRIRENMKNGVAVAAIVRNSCGGCFGKIPPQRHSDIRAHYKIIDCEFCGRILVDEHISGIKAQNEEDKPKTTRRKMRLTATK
jgi:predicted  nucleic acid-binding Zn-ribbon protein